jgi:hypothetical protein
LLRSFGIRLGNVDDAIKEVCFAVLAAEVLRSVNTQIRGKQCIRVNRLC